MPPSTGAAVDDADFGLSVPAASDFEYASGDKFPRFMLRFELDNVTAVLYGRVRNSHLTAPSDELVAASEAWEWEASYQDWEGSEDHYLCGPEGRCKWREI